jgi:pimeloyl-ACP methyl ester carboxylesterase
MSNHHIPSVVVWPMSDVPKHLYQAHCAITQDGSVLVMKYKAKPKAQSLLLMPGLNEPWHSYAHVMPQLAQKFNVFALEWRGHGGSERVHTSAYKVVDYMQDALAALKQVIGSSAWVSGNSLGGLVALLLASRNPLLVRGICLEDAPIWQVQAEQWPREIYRRYRFVPLMKRRQAFESERITKSEFRQLTADSIVPLPEGDFEFRLKQALALASLLRLQSGSVTPRQTEAIKQRIEGKPVKLSQLLSAGDITLRAQYDAMVDPACSRIAASPSFTDGLNPRKDLQQVSCPALFLTADEHLVGLNTAQSTALAMQLCKRTRPQWQPMPGCGHEIHRAAPAAFTSKLMEFVSSEAGENDV